MAGNVHPGGIQRAYDVCVVGSQLGGMVAGALLARRGFRVLHVDHDGLGASYADEGWLLPWAPAVLVNPRLWPAAEAVLGELGLTADVARQLEPCTPDLQVLLPRHRLDLPRDPASRLAELRREFGGDAQRLEAALAEAGTLFDAERPFLAALPPLPPRGLRERWALARARKLSPGRGDGGPLPLSGLGDHPLASALRAFHHFLCHLDGPPTRLAFTRTLGAVLRGTSRLPFGEPGLGFILRRRISESRGDVLDGESGPAVVRSLEVEGGKVSAVRLEGAGDRFVARAVVSATSGASLDAMLPSRDGKPPGIGTAYRPTRTLVSANWVVRAEGLPRPLGQTAIGVTPDGTPLLLQVLPAVRAGRKGIPEPSPGERVVAAATVRAAGEAATSGGDAIAAIRAATSEFLPFLDRITVHESVPPARRGGREAAASIHPLFDPRSTWVLGVGGVATRSRIANLFHAGRDVLPGLGVEGEFHAGLRAADAVEATLGKKRRPG